MLATFTPSKSPPLSRGRLLNTYPVSPGLRGGVSRQACQASESTSVS